MSLTHDLLKKYYGFGQFRPLQEDIVNSVLQGHDVLALLPTGGGKSICFQIPALAMEGICIVVSPLIALMKDQVQQLKKRDIKAYAIYSGLNYYEIDLALNNCINDPSVKFLYVSPERLKTDIFIERIKRMKVNLIAIDEAHCISQWGYDFRPSYMDISELREILPKVSLIALTASATNKVKTDIQEKLGFKKGQVFQKSFARENLSYSCFEEENKEKKLVEILKNVPGSSVVYVRSRKHTKLISDYLKKNNISSDYYHAGLSNEERSKKQEEWISNTKRVIVSTNAFGMGIDKPDVRTVVHIEPPENLESYYQEAGRAGRDEKKAFAVLLYNKNNLLELEKKITQKYPPIDLIRKVYQSLANYYKIAVGSSQMASYDFNEDEFIKIYQLPKVETYYSLKRLESEGFIQLNDSYYNPSRIYITTEHSVLYDFQLGHPDYDKLIKSILRLYGGELYSNFITISESTIAREVSTSTSEVVGKLNYLSKTGMLIYEPQKNKPQLTFITARYDAAKLPLDVKNIEERKKNDLSKLQSVLHYTEQNIRCRTLMILDYFGETSDQNCGVCDVCLRKKKEQHAVDQESKLFDSLIDVLREEELSVDELVGKIEKTDKKLIITTIQHMLDSGILEYNAAGNLKLKK